MHVVIRAMHACGHHIVHSVQFAAGSYIVQQWYHFRTELMGVTAVMGVYALSSHHQ